MNLENNLIDGKYRFSDIVDIGKLTKIFTKFSNITGFTIGLVDNITLEVLISAGGEIYAKIFIEQMKKHAKFV